MCATTIDNFDNGDLPDAIVEYVVDEEGREASTHRLHIALLKKVKVLVDFQENFKWISCVG